MRFLFLSALLLTLLACESELKRDRFVSLIGISGISGSEVLPLGISLDSVSLATGRNLFVLRGGMKIQDSIYNYFLYFPENPTWTGVEVDRIILPEILKTRRYDHVTFEWWNEEKKGARIQVLSDRSRLFFSDKIISER